MNINMDDELRMTRSKFQTGSKSPVTGWVMIIALGVFLGTTASTLGIRAMDNAIARYELEQLNKKLAAEQARMKAIQEEQSRINAVRSRGQQLENEKKQAGYRQAMETCIYWRNEYQKEGTSYNMLQRDQSCNFVNEFR